MIADQPGLSNIEIAVRSGIADQGQISKLLARLARLELAENASDQRTKGTPNAWSLTSRGSDVELAMTRELAATRRADPKS